MSDSIQSVKLNLVLCLTYSLVFRSGSGGDFHHPLPFVRVLILASASVCTGVYVCMCAFVCMYVYVVRLRVCAVCSTAEETKINLK